jgi:Flp pilus assembly protein TadD
MLGLEWIMTSQCWRVALVLAVSAAMFQDPAQAGDLKIPLLGKSEITPVQQLNRNGVKELEKHRLDKAKQLFYRAYLLDPDNPFTLNNLGYVAELEGDADRALRYYQLSSQTVSKAVIALATRPGLKGQEIGAAFATLQVPQLEANKENVQAISLLGQGRVAEAEVVLKKALTADPANPFTQNNLGYVMEIEGNLPAALRYYRAAAARRSQQTVVIAPDQKWRGRPISQVAFENAQLVSQALAQGEDLDTQVARLNREGVAAINHNDAEAARQLFRKAHQLEPHNAFALNNMGYLAEMDGDPETAETYYREAQEAAGAHQQVTFATNRQAEGRSMGDVAENNGNDMGAEIEARQELRRRRGGPIELLRRGGAAANSSPTTQPATERPGPAENNPKQEPPLPVAPPPLPAPQLPDRTTPPPSDPQN